MSLRFLSNLYGRKFYSTQKVVIETCKGFELTVKQLKKISELLHAEIDKGLRKETHNQSIIKCYVTYVQDLPNGREQGKFLALDLGGTNFRVIVIQLAEYSFKMTSQSYAIPKRIMTGSGEELFDHLALKIGKFIKDRKLSNEILPLGFTFSFPLKQTGITKGILRRWTKGFKCSGVEGEDVVDLLKNAIKKRNEINIDLCAILNDTTGTLLSCAWLDHSARIGIIVGTGSNSCYVEKQKNAELFDDIDNGSGNVLINTEWGAFGEDGILDFIRTDFDRSVDKNSVNPGKQLFEKMISGMYLGEMVRLVLVQLTEEGVLFGGRLSNELILPGHFLTAYISHIESDVPYTYQQCKIILEQRLGLRPSMDDLMSVRKVCEIISKRAAYLVGAGIVSLVRRIDEKDITVGIDGSVYRYHPHFHNLITECIQRILNEEKNVHVMLAEDGSGKGAAIIAAVISSKKNRNASK